MMASYDELYGLSADTMLTNRTAVACLMAAEAIRDEDAGTDNHANRLVWARQCFENPRSKAVPMLRRLLANFNELTVEQITGATDAAIQTQVDATVNTFAVGE